MKSNYRKAMENLTLPPGALAEIQNACRKDRREKCQENRRNGYAPHPGKPALSEPAGTAALSRLAGTAAVVILAVVVLSTAAVSAYGHFFHPIPEDVAGALRPIQLTSTSQDITLTVQYASVEKGALTAYLTLEDVSGLNRLSRGVDFYHSYHADKPEETRETSYQYQSLGYDDATHTYGFLVTITPTDASRKPLYLQEQQFTLSVDQLLLSQNSSEPVLYPDWNSLPSQPAAEYRDCHAWSYVDTYSRTVPGSDDKVLVLLPGNWGFPAADGFTVTAAGFLDTGFHIQLRQNRKDAEHDYGALILTDARGNAYGGTLECNRREQFCSVSFRDASGYEYTEFIYDISPEELAGASLRGSFRSGGFLLDGDWEVTFSFEEK